MWQGITGNEWKWIMAISDISTLVIRTCPNCGVRHAFPERLNQEAMNSRGMRGRQISCPNGHTWHYTGKTEAEQEREWREDTQRRLETEKRARDCFERSLRTTKGQVTKLRKRLGLEV